MKFIRVDDEFLNVQNIVSISSECDVWNRSEYIGDEQYVDVHEVHGYVYIVLMNGDVKQTEEYTCRCYPEELNDVRNSVLSHIRICTAAIIAECEK